MRFVMITALLVLAMACAKKQGSETTTTTAGSERGPCYGNGTCNEGLICLSDLCVRPPPADCAAVAKKVGYLMLSNYAPAEERASFESGIVTECKDKHLTKEEGDCILRSQNRGQLNACGKPLGQGSCDRIVEHIRVNLAPNDRRVAEFLERGVDEMIAECEKEGITAAVERCALAAKTFDELKKCEPGR